ncbi:MAG: substrate-binding domain-containing protein [Coriobacteriales bacterium]|nr:substrate-binding domain-containing protein [Coriobacteriales bacterium]
MRKAARKTTLFFLAPLLALSVAGCSASSSASPSNTTVTPAASSASVSASSGAGASVSATSETTSASGAAGVPSKAASSAVNLDRRLDSYKPQKSSYNFYFTYKIVHSWWDAVALGMEEAQRQYLDKGVTITYDYMAPKMADAQDQVDRLRAAAQENYDVIGVDVADEAIISPVLDELVDAGKKVMTFSSSDAAPGCKRIAYVGNTHNCQDGEDLTEALCKKLNRQGKVAILVGSVGAPCHEERARGAKDVIAKYPNMQIVACEYDLDSVDLAHELALEILEKHPDLDGFVCCNMSNPVGAARAVIETGSNAVIAGMDHDQEALHYLHEGIIYCLGVQDCYSIGFDTLQTAVKIADGGQPGRLFPDKTDEMTTVLYQQDAALMLELLYGDAP